MTTPTQEEKDRALEWARNPWHARSPFIESVQRCHLHATAELARAEETVRLFRAEMFGNDMIINVAQRTLNRVDEGLARYDDKLARGEAKETEMDCDRCDNPDCPEKCAWHGSKFTPKPGDRVVLVKAGSPNDRCHENKSGVIGARGSFNLRLGRQCNWHVCFDDGTAAWLDDDAVFAPAPAQAEQPTSVASGMAAGEVTDDNLGRAVRQEWVAFARTLEAPKAHWLEPYEALSEDMKEVDRRIGRALHNAGRASRDAEVAEFRRALGSAKDQLDKWRGVLSERDAEVAELKRELEGLKTRRYREVGTLRQELEAEKASHDGLRRERDHYAHEASRLGRELLAAQKARAVPSLETVVNTLDRRARLSDEEMRRSWREKGVDMPENIEGRVAELELQGRVVRRWMNASVPVQTYERIEREERERAGKP
jgi:hypothetical protein